MIEIEIGIGNIDEPATVYSNEQPNTFVAHTIFAKPKGPVGPAPTGLTIARSAPNSTTSLSV